jgi:hypothetical protein
LLAEACGRGQAAAAAVRPQHVAPRLVDPPAGGDRRAAARAPRHGGDAGQQFARRGALLHVIVGAEFEAEDAVDLGRRAGQHDAGQVADLSQVAQHRQTGLPGQPVVEQEDVRPFLRQRADEGLAASMVADAAPVVRQEHREFGGERRVVIHQGDPVGHPTSASYRS